jgi:hypothetical protein
MVERFFRDVTQNRLKRGVFRDVEELTSTIGSYIDTHNLNPTAYCGRRAGGASVKRSEWS